MISLLNILVLFFRIFARKPSSCAVSFGVLFCLANGPVRAEPYDNVDHPIRVQLMQEVDTVYKEQGIEAARAELDAYMRRMKESGFHRYDVYSHVWRYGQLHVTEDAWAEALRDWLIHDSVQGDVSGNQIPYGHLTGVHSVWVLAFSNGKLARAEYWAGYAKRLMRIYFGMDLNVAVYPEKAELLHPVFPDLRRRVFPLRLSNQRLSTRIESDKLLTMLQVDGLRILHEQAMARGDWRLSLQLADWVHQVGEELLKDPTQFRKHIQMETWVRNARAEGELINFLWLLGRREEALARLSEQMTERPAYYYGVHVGNKMKQIGWEADLGRPRPDGIDVLDRLIARGSEKERLDWRVGAGQRAKIRWYFAQNERSLATGLMSDLFEDREPGMADFELFLDLALRDDDRRPEVESVFLALLKTYRHRGLKIREPFLYERYAGWLALNGRWEEAVAIQREAIRLFNSFGLDLCLEPAWAKLDQYLAMLTAPEQDEVSEEKTEEEGYLVQEGWPLFPAEHLGSSPPPVDVSGILSDLQPVRQVSVVSPGDAAISQFTLANAGRQALSGDLVLFPVGKVEVSKEKSGTAIRIHPGEGEVRVPLNVSGEAMQMLEFEAVDGVAMDLDLRWMPSTEGIGNGQSRWTRVEGDPAQNGGLTNAGAYIANPFYLVPVYQSLVREETGSEELVNFRVVSSEPCRIEVYEVSTGHPVYIDFEGDGDLHGSGDMLRMDKDMNGIPDVGYAEDTRDSGFVIYFTPSGDLSGRELQLTVELPIEGEWTPMTQHVIHFSP